VFVQQAATDNLIGLSSEERLFILGSSALGERFTSWNVMTSLLVTALTSLRHHRQPHHYHQLQQHITN